MTTRILPAIAIGSSTSGSWLLAQLSASTAVPLGEALAAFVFVATLVWWLSTKMTRIEDNQTRNAEAQKRNEDALKEIRRSLQSATCERREVREHLEQEEHKHDAR
jgi:large-conductance mechanosensitive channel